MDSDITKFYILEHDARVNASRDSKDSFDLSIIIVGSLYAVMPTDWSDIDKYTTIAIYSNGKCVHNPTYFEKDYTV